MDPSADSIVESDGIQSLALLVWRIAGSAAIFLATVWFHWQRKAIHDFDDGIFVLGGKSPVPGITQIAQNCEFALGFIVPLIGVACIVLIWAVCKKKAQVTGVTLAGTSVAVLTGMFFQIALEHGEAWFKTYHRGSPDILVP